MIMFRCCSSAGITFLVFALLWISCEEPTVKDDSPDETMQNTLETDLGILQNIFMGLIRM